MLNIKIELSKHIDIIDFGLSYTIPMQKLSVSIAVFTLNLKWEYQK